MGWGSSIAIITLVLMYKIWNAAKKTRWESSTLPDILLSLEMTGSESYLLSRALKDGRKQG